MSDASNPIQKKKLPDQVFRQAHTITEFNIISYKVVNVNYYQVNMGDDDYVETRGDDEARCDGRG